jgi:hypothetical protein
MTKQKGSEGGMTEIVIGSRFPGEITGEEARKLGIRCELTDEAKQEIERILAQCHYLRGPWAYKP